MYESAPGAYINTFAETDASGKVSRVTGVTATQGWVANTGSLRCASSGDCFFTALSDSAPDTRVYNVSTGNATAPNWGVKLTAAVAPSLEYDAGLGMVYTVRSGGGVKEIVGISATGSMKPLLDISDRQGLLVAGGTTYCPSATAGQAGTLWVGLSTAPGAAGTLLSVDLQARRVTNTVVVNHPLLSCFAADCSTGDILGLAMASDGSNAASVVLLAANGTESLLLSVPLPKPGGSGASWSLDSYLTLVPSAGAGDGPTLIASLVHSSTQDVTLMNVDVGAGTASFNKVAYYPVGIVVDPTQQQ